MVTSRFPIVPRYVETDQMGFVSDESFIPWLECARAAMLKENGMDYRKFEAMGFWLPVLELGLTFRRPAYYDDSLVVVTTLRQRPTFRIRLEYEIKRNDEVLAQGFSIQAFVNPQHKPVKPPPAFTARINELFPRGASGKPAPEV